MSYNRKVLKTATKELGKAKAPAKQKDIITDPMGQWKYPGQNTRIPGSNITMQNVPYPVWAQPNVGPGAMMYPEQEYQFPGADYVDEFPQGSNEDYYEDELDEEQIAELRAGGYTVEDISVPQLTQAQKGITISNPQEYAFRKAAYDDSLHLYNTYKNLEPKKVGKMRSTKNTWHSPYRTYTATKTFTPTEKKEWENNHGGRSQAFSNYASKLLDAEMEKGNFDFDWPTIINDPIGYKANVGIYNLRNKNTGKDAKNMEIAFRFKKPVQQVYKSDEEPLPKEYKPNLDTDLAAWLKTQKAPTSYADRKKLYEQATGKTDYKGTAEQNIGLLKLLKQEGLDYKMNNQEFPESIELPQESQSIELPTKPVNLIKSDTIKAPSMRLEWFQTPTGTWYQDYIPDQVDYNINTGSYKKLGGLTKAQKGYITPTDKDSLSLYNNSLQKQDFYKKAGYNKLKSFTNFKDPKVRADLIYDVNHTKSKDLKINPAAIDDLNNQTNTKYWNKYLNQNNFGPVKGTNLTSFGDILMGSPNNYYHPESPKVFLHPNISPQGSIGYEKSGNHFSDGTNIPYYDPIAIKPGKLLTDAEIKTRVKKYGTVGIPTSRLTALNIPFKSNENNKPEREPLPEINKLPIKHTEAPALESIPQTFNYTPKKQESIEVANRSQTVMEPDPNRPGKYRMKEMRQVPYSAKFPGEANWEPANAPRVIYVDAEGNETEERPGAQLNTLDLQGETFKQGGSLLTKKVTCKKCSWEWDAADGGNDITTCHKCGGQGLIHAQNGISTPYYSYNNEEPTSYDPITQTVNFNEESLTPPEGFTGNLKQFINDEYRAQNAHENFHHWQNQTGQGRIETGRPDAVPTFPSNQKFEGDHYYNRREVEEKQKADEWRKAHPNESSFINPDILYNKVTNAVMYDDPNTLEGQARKIEEKVRENKSHQPFNLINPGLTNPWKKQNNVGLVHSKKGGSLKKYSRSMEATNKLFRESPLLKKTKSKKKKIFDPSSNYFQDGGPKNTVGPINEVEEDVIPQGTEISPDYDLKRFYIENPMGAESFMAGQGHATDEYKLPNHPTFSDHTNWADGSVSHGSLYSNAKNPGGEWVQKQDGSWHFNTSHANRSNMSESDMKQYFNEVEPGNTLEYKNGGTNNNYIEVDADDNDIANYIAQGYQVEELPKAQYAGQTPFVHPDAGATNVLFQKPTTTKPNSKYNKNTPVNYQAKLKPVVADNTRDVTADQTLAAIQNAAYMESPEYKARQKAEKEAQAKFEKEQWDKYNKMSFGEKVRDRTNAALNQWPVMLSNTIAGEQAYIPGMASGLGDGGPDYDKWLKATGQTRGFSINDAVNVFNPGNWGGHAGRQYGEGNYLTGAGELGLGLLGLKGAPLMGNQLAKSSANKLINLEQKAGQALSTPKNLINNLSKSKNIKQAVGSFAGVPPEGALPRMSSDELKTFRKIQEIGRMQSKFAPISEQYEYALKQGIPDEHIRQVFGKSKEEIESAISILQEQEAIRRATPISARETIDLSRQPTEGVVTNDFRRITAESTPEEIAGFADHMNMPVDQLRGLMERSAATNRSNIIRHALEDNYLPPPPEELILNTSRRQTLSDEDVARFVNNMAPPEGQFRVYSDFSMRNNAVNLYGQNKSFSLPKIKEDRLINFSSAYPMYKGRVIQNVPSLSLRGSGSLKNVSDKVASESTANINSGDVFTGSLNTSHSSYLPQLKQTFKYTEGAPQFVGYQPMNSLGFLSDFHYSNEDIAKYLNTEIDEQIKRGIVPKDVLRPYIQHNKPNRILLPHYGIKQFEDGGSLELDLSPEEIQAYKDGGYIVEELPHAQDGVATPRKKIINYVPNVKEVESILPMGDMFNKFKQLKTVAQAKPQQKVAPVKPMVLPSWMEHAVNTPTVAKPVEPLQLPSWMTHAINTANVSAPESEYRIPINSNAPIGIPASASNMNTQPIQNNFVANNFTNTGIPRQIDYNHLATNEAKRLNTKGMKEVPETPSFLENVGNFLGNIGPGNWIDNYYENNEEYINRYLEKKGVINPEEFKLKTNNISIPKIKNDENKVNTFYQELGTVQDNRSTNPTDSLLSYRNQFDANKGFTYITSPVKKDRTNKEVYDNVEGVGHFVLDASPNFEHPYIHPNNFSFLKKAINNNDFIPVYESTGVKGEAKLTYKRAKDIDSKILNKIIEAAGKISSTNSETERQNIANKITPFLYGQKTKVISPLRQMKFDEIKFNQTQQPKGFNSSVKELKKANGDGTYLIFKDRDAYSRFSGGSVTFLFKDKKGNLIAREFAGTLNNIENEGISIKKEFGLKDNELTLGYHDVGSFSAKPKAKNNLLSSEQWRKFNTAIGDDSQNPTGGALIIPKQNVKH